MRRYREALRALLQAETKAYGFTLVIWGTGLMTETRHGSPGQLSVIAFVGGAFTAMALVIIATAGGPRGRLGTPRRQSRYALGSVHLLSVASAIASGWAVSLSVPGKALAYLSAAATAVLVYQLVVGLEVAVSGGHVQSDGGSDSGEPS